MLIDRKSTSICLPGVLLERGLEGWCVIGHSLLAGDWLPTLYEVFPAQLQHVGLIVRKDDYWCMRSQSQYGSPGCFNAYTMRRGVPAEKALVGQD